MIKGRKQNTAKRKVASKETSLELVSSNFDEATKEGKRVVEEKSAPNTQVKKIRLTGYVEPEIYKRIVNGMLEERMKKRAEGQEGIQGKSDLSFVVSEAMGEWLEKRKY
jgi:hypothetical protein